MPIKTNLIAPLSLLGLLLVTLPVVHAQENFSNNADRYIDSDFYLQEILPSERLGDPIYTDPYGTDGTDGTDADQGIPENIPTEAVEQFDLAPFDLAQPEEIADETAPVTPALPQDSEPPQEPEITIPTSFFANFRMDFMSGFGFELGGDISNHFRLRAAATTFAYNLIINLKNEPSNYINLQLLMPELLLDMYPVADSSFRFTLGASYLGHRLTVSRQQLDLYGYSPPASSIYAWFPNFVGPTIGFGWDFARNGSNVFIGSIELLFTWTGPLQIKSTDGGADLFSSGIKDIEKRANSYYIYSGYGLPRIAFTMGWKF